MDMDARTAGDCAKFPHRQPDAADVRRVGKREDAGPRSERLAEWRDQLIRAGRTARHGHGPERETAPTGADRPGDIVGRMVLVPDHDLVAGPEFESVVDDIVPFARVAHQRNLVRRRAQLARDGRTGRLQVARESLAILEGAVHIDRTGQLGHSLRNARGRRAQIRRIHRHALFSKREPFPNALPVLFVRGGSRRRQRANGQRGRGRHASEELPPGSVRNHAVASVAEADGRRLGNSCATRRWNGFMQRGQAVGSNLPALRQATSTSRRDRRTPPPSEPTRGSPSDGQGTRRPAASEAASEPPESRGPARPARVSAGASRG